MILPAGFSSPRPGRRRAFGRRPVRRPRVCSGIPKPLTGGTAFAIVRGVGTVARALHARFEEVSRAEIRRLRRKTKSLSAAQREQVDDLAAEVVRGIAARATEALRREDDERIAPVVAQLFRI